MISDYMKGDGVKLHVMKDGDADAPLVVLLHGFPEFWYSWRHQMKALVEAGYSIVAPDQRGYNLSDKPNGYSAYHLRYLVADVAAIVRGCGRERAHIVGHDWGGIVAWAFAGQHPELLDKLVIMNAPHSRIYREQVTRPPQLFMSWYIGFFCLPIIPEVAMSARDYAAVRDMFKRSTIRDGAFSAADMDKYIEALGQPGALTAALNWYRCGMLTRGGLRLAADAYVEAPTQIIWGEEDVALNLGLLNGLEKYAPNLNIHRIPNCGHWVQNEAADEVNQVLLRFLAS